MCVGVSRYRCPIAQEPVLETSDVDVREDGVEVRRHYKIVASLCRRKQRSEPSLSSHIIFQLCHGHMVLEVCEFSQYKN